MSFIEIRNDTRLNHEYMCLLKPIYFSQNNRKYDIRYTCDREHKNIVLLTDKIGINYGIYSYTNFTNNYYIDIYLSTESWELKIVQFINNSLVKIAKASKIIPYNYKFISSFKNGKLICKTNNNENDINRGKIYRFAICPNYIWCSKLKKNYGIEWIICDYKESNNLKNFSIPINKKEGVLYKDHDNYQKFFKMLKVGIPLGAVKNKMELLGEDSSIIEKPDDVCDGCKHCSNNTQTKPNNVALLNEIKKGINLNKITTEPKKESDNKEVKNKINLDEILSIKCKLKKTTTNESPYWK